MVVFWRQIVHHGAASDDHLLLGYPEHLLHEPPDLGSDVASSPEGLQRRVEGDDVREAPRRIIELGYVGQPGGDPSFGQMLYEGGGVIVAVNVIVKAGQGYRPAGHIQYAPVQIYTHLVQVALKPISRATTVSSATYQIYAPRFSQKRSVTGRDDHRDRPGAFGRGMGIIL
jgi:hypothetical protein